MELSDVFEVSPSDEGGIKRLGYVLKNGRALNIYGALKELNKAQSQLSELKSKSEAALSDLGYLLNNQKVSSVDGSVLLDGQSAQELLELLRSF